MTVSIQTPGVYLWIIRVIGLLVPKESRFEWRREWEAEVVSHWLLLAKWERLNVHSKLDLFNRVQGSFLDVLSFQQRRTSLVLVSLNLLVALLTGYGALQTFIIDGIRCRQLQPLVLSLVAIIVSSLFITSGIALFRRWPNARRFITLTGTLSILVHVYGALPPHRNMGFLVLIVGAGYGLVMLLVFEWNEKRARVS
jgi:hypothetical protein